MNSILSNKKKNENILFKNDVRFAHRYKCVRCAYVRAFTPMTRGHAKISRRHRHFSPVICGRSEGGGVRDLPGLSWATISYTSHACDARERDFRRTYKRFNAGAPHSRARSQQSGGMTRGREEEKELEASER